MAFRSWVQQQLGAAALSLRDTLGAVDAEAEAQSDRALLAPQPASVRVSDQYEEGPADAADDLGSDQYEDGPADDAFDGDGGSEHGSGDGDTTADAQASPMDWQAPADAQASPRHGERAEAPWSPPLQQPGKEGVRSAPTELAAPCAAGPTEPPMQQPLQEPAPHGRPQAQQEPLRGRPQAQARPQPRQMPQHAPAAAAAPRAAPAPGHAAAGAAAPWPDAHVPRPGVPQLDRLGRWSSGLSEDQAAALDAACARTARAAENAVHSQGWARWYSLVHADVDLAQLAQLQQRRRQQQQQQRGGQPGDVGLARPQRLPDDGDESNSSAGALAGKSSSTCAVGAPSSAPTTGVPRLTWPPASSLQGLRLLPGTGEDARWQPACSACPACSAALAHTRCGGGGGGAMRASASSSALPASAASAAAAAAAAATAFSSSEEEGEEEEEEAGELGEAQLGELAADARRLAAFVLTGGVNVVVGEAALEALAGVGLGGAPAAGAEGAAGAAGRGGGWALPFRVVAGSSSGEEGGGGGSGGGSGGVAVLVGAPLLSPVERARRVWQQRCTASLALHLAQQLPGSFREKKGGAVGASGGAGGDGDQGGGGHHELWELGGLRVRVCRGGGSLLAFTPAAGGSVGIDRGGGGNGGPAAAPPVVLLQAVPAAAPAEGSGRGGGGRGGFGFAAHDAPSDACAWWLGCALPAGARADADADSAAADAPPPPRLARVLVDQATSQVGDSAPVTRLLYDCY
ncbi:hypothetical protein FOA52_012443 [Chlamydomonas sp. UWO 241]|nr:hypothetical protein FOA52_012443 [Chlamydomonas sp. UWO 241]